MKRVRGDEPEASAVGGEGDAPVVVDAAEVESSSGTRAARRRAVTVEGSAQPAVVAVADEAKGDVLASAAQEDDQGLDPNDPYYRDSMQYRTSIEYILFDGPRECDEFEEEAPDDGSEVLCYSDRSPFFLLIVHPRVCS